MKIELDEREEIKESLNPKYVFKFEDGYEYKGNTWLTSEQLYEQFLLHGQVEIKFNEE